METGWKCVSSDTTRRYHQVMAIKTGPGEKLGKATKGFHCPGFSVYWFFNSQTW
jgi:hypothetical protein